MAPTVHREGLCDFSGVRTTGADVVSKAKALSPALSHFTDSSGVKVSPSENLPSYPSASQIRLTSNQICYYNPGQIRLSL